MAILELVDAPTLGARRRAEEPKRRAVCARVASAARPPRQQRDHDHDHDHDEHDHDEHEPRRAPTISDAELEAEALAASDRGRDEQPGELGEA